MIQDLFLLTLAGQKKFFFCSIYKEYKHKIENSLNFALILQETVTIIN